MDEPKLET